jgi:hypothetical protein
MAVDLAAEVNERSAVTFRCVFTDEDGTAVIPSSIHWTWTDNLGAVVNSRSSVTVGTPASTTNITIGSTDTAIQSITDDGYRRLTVRAVYNSTYGNNQQLNEEAVNIKIVGIPSYV